MTRHRLTISNERGFALIYIAVTMVALLLFTGLAIDSGRAYVVKAQLTKAVDGAALGAARMLNSGNPKDEATKIFKQNFASGYMATETTTDPTTAANFFDLQTNTSTGVNVVTVTASVTMPTTFMKLANLNQVVVSSSGQATRRMVDLSLVLDVSSSIASKWPAVRDAARTFVSSFDANGDRIALVTYGNGAKVIDQMRATRGFAKSTVVADIPQTLPGGSTAMVEGLYRGWDELRSVPAGTQSGLRVLVLFTDGASNSVPGFYDSATVAKGFGRSTSRRTFRIQTARPGTIRRSTACMTPTPVCRRSAVRHRRREGLEYPRRRRSRWRGWLSICPSAPSAPTPTIAVRASRRLSRFRQER